VMMGRIVATKRRNQSQWYRLNHYRRNRASSPTSPSSHPIEPKAGSLGAPSSHPIEPKAGSLGAPSSERRKTLPRMNADDADREIGTSEKQLLAPSHELLASSQRLGASSDQITTVSWYSPKTFRRASEISPTVQ